MCVQDTGASRAQSQRECSVPMSLLAASLPTRGVHGQRGALGLSPPPRLSPWDRGPAPWPLCPVLDKPWGLDVQVLPGISPQTLQPGAQVGVAD